MAGGEVIGWGGNQGSEHVQQGRDKKQTEVRETSLVPAGVQEDEFMPAPFQHSDRSCGVRHFARTAQLAFPRTPAMHSFLALRQWCILAPP